MANVVLVQFRGIRAVARASAAARAHPRVAHSPLIAGRAQRRCSSLRN